MGSKRGGKSSRTRKPSLREQAEAMAERGDITALVKELATGWTSTLFHADDKAGLLREAIRQNADEGPIDLADAVLLEVIAFDAEFLLRTQMGILRQLERIDHASGSNICNAPSPSLRDDMDRLMQMEDHLLDMMRRYATIRHALALSEPNREMALKSIVQTDNSTRSEKIIPISSATKMNGGWAKNE